ncbi:MAG: polysaccharide deacetylase family protein [Flavobacteriales bacterium]
MYFVKTPSIIKPLGRDFLWNYSRDKREVYLTFDDGPTPRVTEQVLELLNMYNAKATFFCIGKNAEQHTKLFQKIRDEGHATGNHSYSHQDGWKTCTFSYLKDALRGNEKIQSSLFRPPYGHITLSQASLLKRKFQLVMWDVISGDFDQRISKEKCLRNVIENVQNGSIVVFHDSVKASSNMMFAVERSLKHFTDEGFTLRAIQ